MSDSTSDLLIKSHYETSTKLHYFILSADIALLGWTVVNTNWIPKQGIFIYLVDTFWLLIVLSIVAGIIRQLYDAMAFGINFQYLQSAELASTIERSSMEGGSFKNQQTGEVISSQEFGEFAKSHRKAETAGKNRYKTANRGSEIYGDLSIIFLVVALFLFAIVKILIFSYSPISL